MSLTLRMNIQPWKLKVVLWVLASYEIDLSYQVLTRELYL